MKVFIGWSGETSHQVALALHDWLPKVIQVVKPYVSSEDIAKGARWSTMLAAELRASFYGVICVTKENAVNPWINFEAGALSREIEQSRVTPFLFGVRPSDIQGPLAQFQAVINEEEDVLKLISSINQKIPEQQRLEADALKDSFQVRWPQLKDRLAAIEKEASSRPTPPRRENNEILEDILSLVRTNQAELDKSTTFLAYLTNDLAEQQEARTTKLDAVISALARSVESLHAEFRSPNRRLGTSLGNYGVGVVQDTEGMYGLGLGAVRPLSDLAGHPEAPPPPPPELLRPVAYAMAKDKKEDDKDKKK